MYTCKSSYWLAIQFFITLEVFGKVRSLKISAHHGVTVATEGLFSENIKLFSSMIKRLMSPITQGKSDES